MKPLDKQTLGKYEVMHEIGRGSMGTVYLGYDPFAGRDVAIKVAHADPFQEERAANRYRKMFFNEAKVAGMLKHPNIVSVFDAGVDEDVWYIVMELVPAGQTLYPHCTPDNLLPMEDVVRMVFKCARALDFAHRKGVIHRDIKPRNILLTENLEVKIGDFSIALLTQLDATDTQVLGYVGSPLYMSPEQVRQESLSSQSDIFSLGVVLYQMLTGKHPFLADNIAAISYNITDRAHVPLREARNDAPKILEYILDRSLKKHPAGRYKSALDLAADLSLVFDHIKPSEEDLSGREKFDLVKELSFFGDFADPEIWEVINASSWQEFYAGDTVINEGEVDTSFFIIVTGDVLVRKGEKEVAELTRGDCFGEMGFIARQERTASIIAKTEIYAMQVRASQIERASMSCQLRFHKVFLNTLVQRLSRTTETATKPGA